MKIKFWSLLLLALCGTTALWAQRNPNESQLLSQINSLKEQLVKIDTTIVRGDGKGRFSAGASDSLYRAQDYLMDLNDKLYWLTNKDSVMNAPTDRETPREDEIGMDGKSIPDEINTDTIPIPKLSPDFDFSNLLPKPKVKKYGYFFQIQTGVALVSGKTNAATTTPEWKPKLFSNPGATVVFALRLGKPDVSKLKMEFNIKKKLTTSNFLKASPWQLRIGIGLQRYVVQQTTNFDLNRDETTKAPSFTTPLNNVKYDNNTVNIYYVHVPITVWRKLTSKSFVEVGGFVDILRKNTQTVDYEDNRNINNSLTREGKFGINQFAYGATASIGSNIAAIYFNYHLSSLFAKNSTYDFNLMSVGIRVGY